MTTTRGSKTEVLIVMFDRIGEVVDLAVALDGHHAWHESMNIMLTKHGVLRDGDRLFIRRADGAVEGQS